MDLFARSRWTEYARARDAMLRRTDHAAAPWFVVPSDNKKAARLNCISDLLSRISYEEIHPPPLALPPRDSADTHPDFAYAHPPVDAWRYVKPIYDEETLMPVVSTKGANVDGALDKASWHADHDDDEEEEEAQVAELMEAANEQDQLFAASQN